MNTLVITITIIVVRIQSLTKQADNVTWFYVPI